MTVQVFWLKDNVELNVQQDINFIISSEGSLIINQARLQDTGNYTCGATNQASRRLSDSASLLVYCESSALVAFVAVCIEGGGGGEVGERGRFEFVFV